MKKKMSEMGFVLMEEGEDGSNTDTESNPNGASEAMVVFKVDSGASNRFLLGGRTGWYTAARS
jgi:hypothetical protein